MNPIKHCGPIDANIAIVGMAPGDDEVKSGTPFTGPAGQLLTNCMRQVGMSRGDCFITNLSEYQPPKHDLSLLSTIGVNLDNEINRCKNELRRVSPRVILCLGADALYHLTGYSGIYDMRGSPIKCNFMTNSWIIPSIHPAALLRGEYKHSAYLMYDIMKCMEIAKHKIWRPIDRIYRTNPTFLEVIEYLKDIVESGRCFEFDKARLGGIKTKVAIDLETNFMSKDNGLEYIRCFGIAKSPADAMCIPIHTSSGSRWSINEEYEIWTLIRKICQHEYIIKVAQNQSFEMSVLHKWVGEIHPIRDTAIGHHLINPETPKALQFLTSVYTDMPFYKDDAKNSTWEDEATWLYNCKDCVVTYEINTKVEEDLKQLGLYTPFYTDYQVPIAKILWEATMTGILVDTKKVLAYRAEYEALRDSAQEQLNKLAGREINVNSPPGMKWLLYEKMGLPKQYNKVTKKVSTDEKSITKLAKMFPNEIFNLVLEVRKYRKLLSTYLKEFWDSDNRCRSDMRVWGTVTGRLAAMENYRGTGLNMQNIPPDIKDIFIADEGYVLLRVDKEQVESILTAYMAQDLNMIQCFLDKRDIHRLVGSMVYNIPYENLTKDSPERGKGKTLGHSANYKVGPMTFAGIAEVPVSTAKLLLEKYYKLFRLGIWHDEVKERVRKDRTFKTIYGRRRTFFDRWGDRLFREAIANEPQSTACDHLNMAAVRIDRRKIDGMHLLLQVHDELVYLVREDIVQQSANIIMEELSVPLIIKGRTVNLPTSIQIGKDWKNVTTYDYKSDSKGN